MVDRFVELIYFLRKLVEGRDKSGIKRRILIHCQDGYTESTILVLGYIMSSLSISLAEAYLHLQNTAGRSFFLYPTDKGLMHKIDLRLAADRKAKALKLVSSSNVTSPSTAGGSSTSSTSSPTSAASPSTSSALGNFGRWKSWTSLGLNKSDNSQNSSGGVRGGGGGSQVKEPMVEAAKQLLKDEEMGGTQAARDAKVWFTDKRFDGFPSRILPFLYLGNLCVPISRCSLLPFSQKSASGASNSPNLPVCQMIRRRG